MSYFLIIITNSKTHTKKTTMKSKYLSIGSQCNVSLKNNDNNNNTVIIIIIIIITKASRKRWSGYVSSCRKTWELKACHQYKTTEITKINQHFATPSISVNEGRGGNKKLRSLFIIRSFQYPNEVRGGGEGIEKKRCTGFLYIVEKIRVSLKLTIHL